MIGKKLKYLIKSTKHKQIDLANFLGISPSRLSNYLSDKREPDLAMLAQMVKFLGSDLNTISGVDFGLQKYTLPEGVVSSVCEPSSAYNADHGAVFDIQTVPMNAKKRGINSTTLPISKMFFDDIIDPEKNASIFQVNGYAPEGVAELNDFLVCAKCSAVSLANGNRIFENGRNAKFFRYYTDGNVIILINEDNNKEHIRVDDLSDLDNYYKILWVIKKY